MVNNRNSLTYVANITVLSLSLILFIFITNSALCFSVLMLTCLIGGGVSTLFYSINITEKSLSKAATEMEAEYRAGLQAGDDSMI
jgi:hypothetical protein